MEYHPLLELADCIIEIYKNYVIQNKKELEKNVKKDLLYFLDKHKDDENISLATDEYEEGIRKLKKEEIIEEQKLLNKMTEMRSELEKELSK